MALAQLTGHTTLSQKQVRDGFARVLSERYYASVPAFKVLCDTVLHLPSAAVPVDHTAIRFVDRKAVQEVAFLAGAFGMQDQGVDYAFPDKKLIARSFGIPGQQAGLEFKMFISTLDFAAFSPATRTLLEEDEAQSPHRISPESRSLLENLQRTGTLGADSAAFLYEDLFENFFKRRQPLRLKLAEALAKESPVARIGAICAGELNHVTPFVNRLPAPFNDIEQLRNAMNEAGIEMANFPIQGAPGSSLRQFGTQAVPRPALLQNNKGQILPIQITNEYLELAWRGNDEGADYLYGGFKAEQASTIFTSNVEKSRKAV